MAINGKGWHNESTRHRMARLNGSAGGKLKAPSVRSFSKSKKNKSKVKNQTLRSNVLQKKYSDQERADFESRTEEKFYNNLPIEVKRKGIETGDYVGVKKSSPLLKIMGYDILNRPLEVTKVSGDYVSVKNGFNNKKAIIKRSDIISAKREFVKSSGALGK